MLFILNHSTNQLHNATGYCDTFSFGIAEDIYFSDILVSYQSYSFIPLMKGVVMTLYEQLKSKALPTIKAYHDDLLKHDKNAIETYPKTPFIHFTRECGTHIVFMFSDDQLPKKGEYVPYLFSTADRRHIAQQQIEMIKCIESNDNTRRVMYYNGHTLKDVTINDARHIVSNWYHSCLNRWRNN